MNRLKLAAGLLVIFLLGGLLGALAVQMFYRQGHHDGPPRHRSPSEKADFIMQRLADDLDLTPRQITAIRPIVEQGEVEAAAIMDRVEPELRATHDRNLEAIREKLNPDQQEKMAELRKRMEKFRLEREKSKEEK